jgi:predicted transcriptional regulator
MTKNFVDSDEFFRHNSCMTAKPTEAELAILRVLWDHGPLSVLDIQHILNEAKPTGYTTALKMLQIMTVKGLVERDETVRPQIYSSRYSQKHTQRQLVRDLLSRAFGGSVKELVLQALSTRKSAPEELQAIEKLLDRYENDSKGEVK